MQLNITDANLSLSFRHETFLCSDLELMNEREAEELNRDLRRERTSLTKCVNDAAELLLKLLVQQLHILSYEVFSSLKFHYAAALFKTPEYRLKPQLPQQRQQ
ncbi:CLUMA_CG007784, isoform A [Clunio marinus]|uniref:CLUMA_CG007784, isoform A n=1 Tax=Clunio marinus TaxID=568069 RepID=A0A1J1I1V3_9DIPT|nr:CLUMA_CG007784, isoform A [Clunio marinus]